MDYVVAFAALALVLLLVAGFLARRGERGVSTLPVGSGGGGERPAEGRTPDLR